MNLDKLSGKFLVPILGFSLAGALWGLDIYRGSVGSDEVFINPFSFISGAFLFGILGSASLVIYSGDLKKILKVISIGLVGWVMAFLLPAIIDYHLFILGGLITLMPEFFIESGTIERFTILKPSVSVVDYAFFFFVSGLIVGLVYGFLSGGERKRIVFFSALGFTFGAIIGPIIGNSINTFIDSLFALYLMTFSLIGAILGGIFSYIFRKKPIYE